MFRNANIVLTLTYGSFAGVLFLLPLFLQELRGLSALAVGAHDVPAGDRRDHLEPDRRPAVPPRRAATTTNALVARTRPPRGRNAMLTGYHTAFFVAAGLIVIAAFSGLLIRDEDAASTMRPRFPGPIGKRSPSPPVEDPMDETTAPARGHRIRTEVGTHPARVVIDGEVVAESDHPTLLFETGLPTRYYFPREDVRFDLLQPTDTQTMCPFKGDARYWSVVVNGTTHPDIAWGYDTPIPERGDIAGLVAFYNHRVELWVDGVLAS